MQYIRLAFSGKNNFLSYLLTFFLTVSILFGIGQIPFWLALRKAGFAEADLPGITQEMQIEVLGKNAYLIYQLFPFVIGLGILVFCIRRIHGRPVLTLFTARPVFDWKRFFTGFFTWGLLLLAMLGISYWAMGADVTWNYEPETFWRLLLISIFIIPLQTTFEEAFFRGFLIQGFGSFFRRGWITILFTGGLFGALHAANPEVEVLGSGILAYYIGTGVFLGLIILLDDGLELSLGFHAINNIFGVLIVTNNWQVFQTDALLMDRSKPGFGWESISILLVCFPLMLFIFARIFKWKNWKQRIFGKIEPENQAV
jgi:membrane protease YdiL (CAAX protease family)